MRIAHLADLHLGFRAYHRLTTGGVNARERDIAQAFRAALDIIIAEKPDLILIAGDVFHSVRPSNVAIADAFRQFMRLRTALPDTPVVMIAGDHDSPRSVETGSILRLFGEIPGVAVADDAARTAHLPELDTSVMCVPRNSLIGAERIALEPDVEASTNILLMHATVTGAGIEDELKYLHDYGGPEIDHAELRAQDWDYVALGHFHIMTALADNMWYAGAIERTSRNPWRESKSEKGFLIYDTVTRTAQPYQLPGRAIIDLPRFSARLHHPGNGSEAAYMHHDDVNARIRQLIEGIAGGLEDKIVRLVIDDVPRDLFRALDHRAIREYKSRALHFHLDARRPEIQRVNARDTLQRRRTLEEEVDSFLHEHWRVSTPDIEPQRLAALAHRYLEEAWPKVESEEQVVE